MKKYGVAIARARLAEALDYADRGVPVVIERRGVRYRLSVDRSTARPKARQKPYLTIVDAAVERGEWTWDWAPGKFAFKESGRRR